MANSIVFQNSAEQLKTGIYGYDGTSYKPIKINTNGELEVIVGTLKYVAPIGTLNYVAPIGTLKYVAPIGTLKYVAPIGTLKYVAPIGTLKYIETVKNVTGTVKVNLVDRNFTSITQTIQVATGTPTYTNLIDISKYQDTSWYIMNTTGANRAAVTIELSATPSNTLSIYPLAPIQETATVNANPQLITNNRYAKYISANITNSSGNPQTIVVVFNGRS